MTFFQCIDKPEGGECVLQCDGSNPSVTDPPETTKNTETTEKPEPPPSVDCNCPRSNPTRQNVKDENDNHVISCDGVKICEGICRQPNMNKINVSLQLLIEYYFVDGFMGQFAQFSTTSDFALAHIPY